jgi:hypothetical protein
LNDYILVVSVWEIAYRDWFEGFQEGVLCCAEQLALLGANRK